MHLQAADYGVDPAAGRSERGHAGTVRPNAFLADLPVFRVAASSGGASPLINLATNESMLGASPLARAAYASALDRLHHYPASGAAALRHAIADAEGLAASEICCGAGSEELITLLARAFAGPGDEVIHSAHGFPLFGLAARAVGARPIAAPERALALDVQAILDRVTRKTRIVFLANPNNPTGALASQGVIRHLRSALPEDVLLVLDGAYAEYVGEEEDYEAGHALVREGWRNVAVLRTFSKIHGLAGLRVGWMHAPAAIVECVDRLRGVYNVSLPATLAAAAAITDKAHVARARALTAANRGAFLERLARLGVAPPPSAANFVLLDFRDRPAMARTVVERFAAGGVLTYSGAAAALPDCLRVTIGAASDLRVAAEQLAMALA